MSAVMNGLPPWATAKHFRRNQGYTLVTTGIVQLLPANPNRIGCVISAPNQDYGAQLAQSQYAHLVDTSTAGTKISFTVPAGTSALLQFASQFMDVGTGLVSFLVITHGGIDYNITQFTSTQTWQGWIPLTGGDVVKIVVNVGVASSSCDYVLGIMQSNVNNRLMLSVNPSFANDQSINLYPGNRPLILWRDVVGDSITEDIYAHMATTQANIGWWDFFY